MSVRGQKSWKDIRRRRSRSIFTIATVAAAVVGRSMFAMLCARGYCYCRSASRRGFVD